ncbi:cbb3-type cytochrome oxidase assembly protein CcoS [Marinicella sp. S1101]|uniref:cbb3-type cytochrome oxidase assembly protein CcoS n=1 Tax=Marinicella marina TaxID=2996016 RepID=UPI002260A422|nr:cbb3-type cytochrome oxidase assembly protein CcoS [Marinicella marina]MCX7553313.1 cbb3-type cytochrome oxidase assembly protein CcoS [Marinicella marina]MDJ1139045.1 cbb3-type cytochrome oxidase assembly protein CcoS [Marinicella marina]
MNMVFILVLLSLVLAGLAVWSLIWAINKNQFDDLDSPAYSILDDKNEPFNRAKKTSEKQTKDKTEDTTD